MRQRRFRAAHKLSRQNTETDEVTVSPFRATQHDVQYTASGVVGEDVAHVPLSWWQSLPSTSDSLIIQSPIGELLTQVRHQVAQFCRAEETVSVVHEILVVERDPRSSSYANHRWLLLSP